VLLRIKSRGPQRAADLSLALGITAEAARQTLTRLEADGLVEMTTEARGVGRPAQLWSLTSAGHARFPNAHAELTVQLLTSVQSLFGEDAIDRLISAREAESRASYREGMAGARALGERGGRPPPLRTRAAHMVEEGGEFLFVENHCPICAAATSCVGFCRAELRTFEDVLEAKVVRVEHIVEGARRCAYRITPLESGRKARTKMPGSA